MRLSQLLKLKEELQFHNSANVENAVNEYISFINQTAMPQSRLGDLDFFQKINAEYRNIFPLLKKIETLKSEKISDLDKLISNWDKQYFIDSYEMYEDQHKIADVATNRDIRKLHLYSNVKEIVISRIYRYVDWRYPALEIGPGDGFFTEEMSAGDPLYIVDVHQEFLDATKNRFNEFYATRRLRSYLLEYNYDLSMLPQEQMGFVLAWNLFNYFPLEAIKDYLIEIKKVMRPGGYMLFSYNNSERWQNAEMVENLFMCHTPKHMLVPMVESLGFAVVATYDYDPTVCWIEIQKEGELKTSKAHQSMGAIIQILDDDEDPLSIELRTKEELKKTLDAQQRFEIQRKRPDLIQKAKEIRQKYNLTLELAIERVLTDEGIDKETIIQNRLDYQNRQESEDSD